MGLINDKTQTVNNVSLFEVLGNLPTSRATSSLESVKSKSSNLLPFLIDLITITCKDNSKSPREKAKCEASRILTEILVQFFPVLIRILKEGIVKAIKAGLACNTNFTLPTYTVKYKISIKNLDFFNQLKTNPVTEAGALLYGQNPTKDFNFFLFDLIQTGGSANWNGILDLYYDKPSQELEVGINLTYVASGSGISFDKFILDFSDSIELISLENMMARLTNKVTGCLNKALNLTIEQLMALEMIDKLQDNILNADPCKDDYEFVDDYFTFSNEDLAEIEKRAFEKSQGYSTVDLGCEITKITIPIETLSGVFNDIRNSPPSKVTSRVNQSVNILTDALTSNVSQANKNLAIKSMNFKLMELIPKVLTEIVLEPKVVVLYQMCSKLVNGPLNPSNPNVGLGGSLDIEANIKPPNGFDYAKATRVFFEYVTRESLAALLEIIFRQAKKEILMLVAIITAKIVKEQADIRIQAISSIVSGTALGLLSTIQIPNTSENV